LVDKTLVGDQTRGLMGPQRTPRNKEICCALGVLRGSAKGLRKGRFRQPLGGTYFEPEPPKFKWLATCILEVPPKVVGHPPFGRKTDNTNCWRADLGIAAGLGTGCTTILPCPGGFAMAVVGSSRPPRRRFDSVPSLPETGTAAFFASEKW